ncbi:MAG: hypothetical protein Q9174_005639, partial [Haloplaca sp. 1 TL-2023]
MRRRSDSWLNATQILKVGRVEKGKRTKILEKEILTGQHSKIQGGYGKYQGTWINYQRGCEFAYQYRVADLLRPLLEHDMGQVEGTAPGQGSVNTPTKEQAMAAQRKSNIVNGTFDNRQSSQSQSGTFFQNLSKSAVSAVSAIAKAGAPASGTRVFNNPRPYQQTRPPSQHIDGSQESMFLPNSQQSLQSEHSFAGSSHLDPALRNHNGSFFETDSNVEAMEPPRKRARPSSSQSQMGYEIGNDASFMEITPTNGNGSFLLPQPSQFSMNLTGLRPLPEPVNKPATDKQSWLLSLFNEDSNREDYSNHPAIARLSGEDLDIPIDKTAHTALHWAATLGRIHVLRALISRGASVFRVNNGGETALMRAAITTNNYDNNTFADVLKLLGTSIEIQDRRGYTVLHHVAASSGIKGRIPATRAYLHSILEYICNNSSAPNSQQVSFAAGGDHDSQHTMAAAKPIGLARFMSEVVNAQDISGDTALHKAANIGNNAMVQQLLEIGAEVMIPNRRGLRPCDIPGVGMVPKGDEMQVSSQGTMTDDKNGSKFEDAEQQLKN